MDNRAIKKRYALLGTTAPSAEPRGRRVAMGNSWWNNSTKDSTPLNIDSLRKVFDYLGSDEHFKKEAERAEAVSFAMKIIVEAQEAGRITEDEMWRLLGSAEINGGLIVNEQMKKKLIGESNA